MNSFFPILGNLLN